VIYRGRPIARRSAAWHRPPRSSLRDLIHAPALRRRLEHDPTITVFSEFESLEALRLILDRPPTMLADRDIALHAASQPIPERRFNALVAWSTIELAKSMVNIAPA
jgi:hypothetical protein